MVVRSVEAFLDCGRLQGGFARIRCPKCRDEHLLAFSCRTGNFCSSCQAKRVEHPACGAVLFAEKLTTEILAPVPHRHWTFSIPRVLRGLVERDHKLLGLLSQTAYAAILKTFQALFDPTDVRPGCVVSLQTFGVYGEISTRMPTQSFLMEFSLPKENSGRYLRCRHPLSWKCSAAWDITGQEDMVALIACKTRTEFNRVIKHLGAIPHVERTITHVILDVIKSEWEFVPQ